VSHILQNPSQLDELYGKTEANTILANCATTIVLPGVTDPNYLKRIEFLSGQQSYIETDSKGNERVNSRPLVTASEVRTMKQNEGLLISSNINPIKLKLRPLYKNKILMRRAGLISKNGRLVSKHGLAEIPEKESTIKLIDLKQFERYANAADEIIDKLELPDLKNQPLTENSDDRAANPFS